MPDSVIWRKFKDGDEGAFVFIYRTYVNDLFQIGIQLSRDEALVKDCIQEFFIEIRNRIFNLSDTDNIRLYLIKSFRRKVIKYIKKKKRFLGQDQIKEAFFVELAIDENIINAQFNKEQLTKLNKALSQLKVKDREIIYYYFYENFSYDKIAKILDYTHVSSARRSVYKVLSRLRKMMIYAITILLWLIAIQSH
ncbi:sigma-70 family RNA polymerase sigma factor [Fulvivirgaceae bacterium BMA12]|uniref:Sigma-70 family RNA polymerase sigma factor n=1 Tax=Agaribacillus aureus TaxID=3051825 RepID=A0ABT8L7S4_9BACT|nr:sigma-70 family RNA polymerase sigma factor [Fulvivirgaceae bacterium BMA12]